MKKHTRFLIVTLLIIAGISITSLSFAQPPSPPASGSNGGTNTPMGGTAPIDGGLAILLAAGLGYGAKKIYSTKFFRKEPK